MWFLFPDWNKTDIRLHVLPEGPITYCGQVFKSTTNDETNHDIPYFISPMAFYLIQRKSSSTLNGHNGLLAVL